MVAHADQQMQPNLALVARIGDPAPAGRPCVQRDTGASSFMGGLGDRRPG
jgi:hypothetical protein